ncbi:hypothetical protein G6O69_33050 [Pseudenhygromyxa sp. WMMC2535]|uniref:hypothetical protein n=1 Tax=Pseudenhygromyxa sp. WMMC2535 TaxID=2712867 RepID=UPI0015518E67|nr:hypothetical protein [Pseudenhygromyxa sp. WMMC2535]NVB42697.1 hypothetical protein [Pseudenhygromyxa sp. WMMC2535]
MSAGSKSISDVLTREVSFSGEGISVRSLEDNIHKEREVQDTKIDELKVLRERNVEIQTAMTDELKKLRKFSDYLDGTATKGGFWAGFKEVLSYIPGLKSIAISQRSIEELLKQQYQLSAKRVKEAAEYCDILKQSEQELYTEIDRINGKIVEAAQNEQQALDYVLELRELKQQLEAEMQTVEAGSVDARKIETDLDKIQALLSTHSSNVQLYGAAEDRYANLKQNTRKLAETIRNLAQDIQQYTTAASIKLDMASAQIQAIGRAADASVVMLEMKKSLDVMTESMNVTTQFVSDTQVFFRQNLDRLVEELETFDEGTSQMLDENLKKSKEIEEARIQAAIDKAMKTKAAGGEAPAT